VVNISSRAGQWMDGWDVQVLLFLFGSGLAPAPGRARARTSGRQACHVLGSVAARGWSLCACRGSWSWGVVCVARRAPGVTDKTHGFAADMAPTARVRVGARNHSIHAPPTSEHHDHDRILARIACLSPLAAAHAPCSSTVVTPARAGAVDVAQSVSQRPQLVVPGRSRHGHTTMDGTPTRGSIINASASQPLPRCVHTRPGRL
jgi:hypothetical protein